jgi:hypothetical protein
MFNFKTKLLRSSYKTLQKEISNTIKYLMQRDKDNTNLKR